MAGISTHVLNLTTGRPISGMRVELYDIAQKPAQRITSTRTNADGRTDAPMMAAAAARTGDFELRFYVGEHFKEPTALSEEVLVRFSIFDAAQHYHVPMLCSPWFFNTYRGS
ncbi:hydroxyisourate hydrolase [Diaphorobacter ruginosibacter]|uniref:5-hydroxyisourate hydrolase n=1 Tax=Diaphorobacter ruginosibacter TaxID=1715720 RepID=A0A7G9RLY3_9BURK|nr:hydroxyisourate hydrolase [Diaphorobacter ruginosibacter]QNN56608.1 hydroxyisourate hydrolase [Diaphorobacter ruginosibacter]